jgi:hypothetical protein
VTRYQLQSDKVVRMNAQTAMIENGFVQLPSAAPWLAQNLHALTTFPNSRHDDRVDSTAQIRDWFKRGSRPITNAGIFELTGGAPGSSARADAGTTGAASRAARRQPCAAVFRPLPRGGRRRNHRGVRNRTQHHY